MTPPIRDPTPPLGDPPAVFPRSTANEVLRATRYVRAMYRNTPPPRRRRDGGGGGSAVLFGVVTGSTIFSGGSGAVAVGTTSYAVVLKLSGSVAVGVKVYIANVAGVWHIISADCS